MSGIGLPGQYLVPGGRFRELYYWDSYFTMLGLRADGRDAFIESTIDQFTWLIEQFGHVPNGTQSDFLSRSQPPVYFLMCGLSADHRPENRQRRLTAMLREHEFWMRGADVLGMGDAAHHAVGMTNGDTLNRYWDECATPRDESFRERTAPW